MQRQSVAPLAVAFFFFFFASTSFAPSPGFLLLLNGNEKTNKRKTHFFFALLLLTWRLCRAAQQLSLAVRQLGSSAAIAYFIFFRYLFFLSLLLPRAFCTARSGKDLRNIDRYCPRLNLDSCERGKQKAQSLGGKLKGTKRVETILKYAIEYVYILIYKFIYIVIYICYLSKFD